jgi:DNA-binding beta-propeller fold protein YncE
MRRLHFGVILFAALLTGGLPGCSQNNNKGTQGAGAPAFPPGDGNLYVANGGTGSLLSFDNALTAEGNLPPSRHFPETLAGPTGLSLDQTTDTLYVTNTDLNAVLIYENASVLEPPVGSASATRVISGPQTGLRRPHAVAYDAARQRLYVSNEGNSSIVVFQPGCSGTTLLNGDLVPCNVISGPSTLLASPGALAFDPVRDILYVSNRGTNAILIYENASQSSTQGDLPPTRSILLTAPPAGLFIDSANDRLYAVQGSGEGQAAILVYANASTRSGQTSPDWTLTGPNTLLASPAGIDVDTTQDLIYVVNNNPSPSGDSALLIFADPFANCAVCDVTPDRIITGDQTDLASPTDVTVDSQLDRIYVSNTSANTIVLFGMEGDIPPTKINTGTATRLEWPISFFYDSEADRLYVLNFRAFLGGSNAPMIAVWDNVSAAPLNDTPPTWGIRAGSISSPRAIYIDKTRNLLLLLLWATNELRVYNLNAVIPNPPVGNVALPTPVATFTSGLSNPLSMSVDEGRGFAYVANDNNNGVAVYDLNTLNPAPRTLVGSNTQLVRPFGLFIDSERDILYAVNTQSNTILVFEEASGKQGNIAPDRILTSSSASPLADQLNAPTAPFMNVAKDRLFIINRGNNAIYIFDNASTLDGEVEPDRKLIGDNTEISFPSSPSLLDPQITGALWIDTSRGGERIFFGEPIDPTCTLSLNQCPRGAFLLFSAEGNIAPGQVWSGGENRLIGPSAVAVDPRRDLLYVANQGDPALTSDDSISLFTHASRSDGNIPLDGTFSVTQGNAVVTGTGTSFKTDLAPGDLIEIEENTLIISTIYSDTTLTAVSPYPGETASGLIALRLPRISCSPIGTPPCPNTMLNNPAGLFVDWDQNRLYVSNAGNDCTNAAAPCNSLLVFHSASTFNNNMVPDQVITSTRLNSPRGLAVDLERETLYVANHGDNSVLVFKNVEDLNGEVDPDAEIGGAATGINEPIGVAIDSQRDILYVLNQGTPEILVFENASTLDGDSAPARTLSGDFMQTPSFLFLDAEGDLLYVADQEANAVHIFTHASQADGEAAHKTITGVNTGLNRPVGLAVDTAR